MCVYFFFFWELTCNFQCLLIFLCVWGLTPAHAQEPIFSIGDWTLSTVCKASTYTSYIFFYLNFYSVTLKHDISTFIKCNLIMFPTTAFAYLTGHTTVICYVLLMNHPKHSVNFLKRGSSLYYSWFSHFISFNTKTNIALNILFVVQKDYRLMKLILVSLKKRIIKEKKYSTMVKKSHFKSNLK